MSQDGNAQESGDRARRFLFDDADIRGETAHLDKAYRDIIELHQYAPGVSRLLGEFLSAAVLLSSTLKFQGKLVLQARSEGQIPLLMVECSSDQALRAIVRGAAEATSERFDELLAGGHLAITIDPLEGQRYQGIVPLADSLAASLERYFGDSEQLATRIWLACDRKRAAGLLLQQLPIQRVTDPDERESQWQHVCSLAATLKERELLELAAEQVLHRLYHESPVRLFEPRPLMFRCSCSRERTLGALEALGAAELEDLLQELGSITMDCEFCNQQYSFARDDLAEALGELDHKTLH